MINKIQTRIRHLRRDRRYREAYRQFQAYTMVPEHWYISNLKLAERAREITGSVVECGVWKGGMIAGIAEVVGTDRTYYLYDSFEGLPAAKPIDGDRAIAWQQNTDSPTYYDNCTAAVEDAQAAMQQVMQTGFHIHKGWFDDTLPNYDGGPIALLRLDGDWYDSTMTCLTNLFDQVVEGGLVIIDDYYFWDGCTRAVHDFLSKHSETYRIRMFNNQICWIRK